MERELEGKIAIVTGAAQGIGAATAETLRREGATVIVADMNAVAAKAEADKLGGECTFFEVNISEREQLRALVDFAIERFGRIDVLVNNAGVHKQIDFLEITEEEFDRVISINLKGMVFLTQMVMAEMIKRQYGRIVNIASLAGERGGLYAGIHYSTSKAGVINATKCMAHRGGQHNITVNAIAPGLIVTPMVQKAIDNGVVYNVDEVAMKRMGTAEEVAEAVAFLSSDRARYITGCTVDVNGGIFMR